MQITTSEIYLRWSVLENCVDVISARKIEITMDDLTYMEELGTYMKTLQRAKMD